MNKWTRISYVYEILILVPINPNRIILSESYENFTHIQKNDIKALNKCTEVCLHFLFNYMNFTRRYRFLESMLNSLIKTMIVLLGWLRDM